MKIYESNVTCQERDETNANRENGVGRGIRGATISKKSSSFRV